jgi:alpha-tubulin suppressor-like RCC1 family protein
MATIHRDHITPGFMYKGDTSGRNDGSNLIVVTDAKVIGCGAYHSMVITQNGSLLVCGLNNYAQLGIGGTKHTNTLTVVTALENENIVSVKVNILY